MPRNYKEEYKKFHSSPKAKDKRAKLNKINRDKGTYGNGDGKDVSHMSDGSIVLESPSKNRGNKTRTPGDRRARGTFRADDGYILNKNNDQSSEGAELNAEASISPWGKLGRYKENVINWRDNLAKNLHPKGYDPLAKRLKGTILEDTTERLREYNEEDPVTRERVDLLHMVLGKPQLYNTIEESQYRPTKTKGDDSDTVYYRSKQEEKRILEYINNLVENQPRDSQGGIDDFLSQLRSKRGPISYDPKAMTNYMQNMSLKRSGEGVDYPGPYGDVLGNYTLDIGVDEEGREYISYYDKWNINPTNEWQSSSLPFKISDERIDKTLNLKSPEIYGRIYLDELGLEHPKITQERVESTKPKSSYYGQEFAAGGMLNY